MDDIADKKHFMIFSVVYHNDLKYIIMHLYLSKHVRPPFYDSPLNIFDGNSNKT